MNALVRGSLRPDLAAVRADCPPALVALLRRCWDSDAARRPPMAAVVAEVARIEREAAAAAATAAAAAAGATIWRLAINTGHFSYTRARVSTARPARSTQNYTLMMGQA